MPSFMLSKIVHWGFRSSWRYCDVGNIFSAIRVVLTNLSQFFLLIVLCGFVFLIVIFIFIIVKLDVK